MLRSEYAKVATVKSGNSGDVQSLCHCEYAAVHDIKPRTGVLLRYFENPVQVRIKHWLDACCRIPELLKPPNYSRITAVAPEQMAQLRQYDSRQQHQVSVNR